MKKYSGLLFAGTLSLNLGILTSAIRAEPFDLRVDEQWLYENNIQGSSLPEFGQRPCHYECFSAYNQSCRSYCPHISVGVDYLYWNVNQTGLDLVKETVSIGSSSNTCCCSAPCKTETDFFKFKSKSGYRVGVACQLPCWDDLSLNFIYTYFHPEMNKRFRFPRTNYGQIAYGSSAMIETTTGVLNYGLPPLEGCNGAILPESGFLFDQPNSFVHARVKLKYELFDLVFSKPFGCGCWSWTPYIGARVLWLRETLRNNITGTWFKEGLPPFFAFNADGADELDGDDLFVDDLAELAPFGTLINGATGFSWKQKTPAGGLTAGIHAAYYVGDAFSITGHFGLSVLGGKTRYHNNYAPYTAVRCPQVQYRAHHSMVITGWDGALGIAYDWDFCSCPVHLGIGYEIQDWFNLPERVRYINNNNPLDGDVDPLTTLQTSDARGRLTLHGLYVRVAFAF